MVHWAEPKRPFPRRGKKGGTTCYTLTERMHQSFRRMVVVRTESGQSFCLPISTYEGLGCIKKRCKPENHSIIYDINYGPRTRQDEKKLEFSPPGVIRKECHTLSPASRLNYSNDSITVTDHGFNTIYLSCSSGRSPKNP
jgi:hypothetical protein